MASFAQLKLDVMQWLDRRDVTDLIPGWIAMTETDIAAVLRARCMVTRATQPIDAPFIALPSDFISMESIRDSLTGRELSLEDHHTGPLGGEHGGRVRSYRLVADCVEFLPHPVIPDPPDPNWSPQRVTMVWFQRPTPLGDPQDTNAVLEQLYSVYLFGACKYGAIFELDDPRAAQMETEWQKAVFAANLWKQQSDYSGAPLRAVTRGF
jgi:hypothetical protein